MFVTIFSWRQSVELGTYDYARFAEDDIDSTVWRWQSENLHGECGEHRILDVTINAAIERNLSAQTQQEEESSQGRQK